MIKQISQLQAIAQSGLAYSRNPFDIENYTKLMQIAAELLAKNSDEKYDNVLEIFKKDAGYATPKVAVRGVLFEGENILLVQGKADGLWSLPGGWAEVSLSPAESMLKEMREEAGFSCEVVKLLAVLDKSKHDASLKKWPYVYTLFFLCKIISPAQLQLDEKEILQTGFFARDSIPELSTSRTNAMEINLCFRHLRQFSLPSEFD